MAGERAATQGIAPPVLALMGVSGSGKSTIARENKEREWSDGRLIGRFDASRGGC